VRSPDEKERDCYRFYEAWRAATWEGKDVKLELKCFNREDAEEIEKIMKEKYPMVPVYRYTWLVFK
jgi:hypothetical protein